MSPSERAPASATSRGGKAEPQTTETTDGIEVVDGCPLCGSHQLALRFVARDTLHGAPGEWGIVGCQDCRLMHTSPRPTATAMASFYPEEYQPHREHFSPTSAIDQSLTTRRRVRRLLDPKEVIIPDPDRPRRVLEVGCGSGRTLVELADKGWDVHGLEPSAAAVGILSAHRDLPVTIGTIEEVEYPRESFDLIIASMVLEHLHDPLQNAAKLRGWLRHGGHLTGSVPNCASWEFRFFAGDWYALQVPTHLFHFTPATLTRLLEEAGFDHIRVFQQRNVSNLMVHLGRFLEKHHLPLSKTCLAFPQRSSRTVRLAARPAASILAWLGQAGRMSFVAHRW